MELEPLLANLIAWIAIISGLAFGAWWVIGLYGVATRQEEKDLEEEALPAHLTEKLFGIPPVLSLLYIFLTLCSLLYVLFIWIKGVVY